MYDIKAVRGLTRPADIMEWYRSGHNEHDWKSCDGQKPSEGSNPSHSAKKWSPVIFNDYGIFLALQRFPPDFGRKNSFFLCLFFSFRKLLFA